MQVESKKDEIIIKKFLEHIKQIMLRKKMLLQNNGRRMRVFTPDLMYCKILLTNFKEYFSSRIHSSYPFAIFLVVIVVYFFSLFFREVYARIFLIGLCLMFCVLMFKRHQRHFTHFRRWRCYPNYIKFEICTYFSLFIFC